MVGFLYTSMFVYRRVVYWKSTASHRKRVQLATATKQINFCMLQAGSILLDINKARAQGLLWAINTITAHVYSCITRTKKKIHRSNIPNSIQLILQFLIINQASNLHDPPWRFSPSRVVHWVLMWFSLWKVYHDPGFLHHFQTNPTFLWYTQWYFACVSGCIPPVEWVFRPTYIHHKPKLFYS